MHVPGIKHLPEAVGRVHYVRVDRITIDLLTESQTAVVVIKASLLAKDGSIVFSGDYYGGAGKDGLTKEFAETIKGVIDAAVEEVSSRAVGVAAEGETILNEAQQEPIPQSI